MASPPVHPRPAATIVLLRRPYEVLMVRRNPKLAFMGGFWVFPGGKVEPDETAELAALRELTEEAGLALPIGAELVPFARWITPVDLPRRFDTMFFLALADPAVADATPRVDGSEIVDAAWVNPADALTDGRPLAFPTQKQLERLAQYSALDALLAAARADPIEPILPSIVHQDGRPAEVVMPGEIDGPAAPAAELTGSD